MAIAEIDGGKLSYELTGNGPPLLLLLPQSSGPNGIQLFVERLAKHNSIIAYHQRGTGHSSPAPDALSMSSQATDAIGLLDSLGIDKASLLCHSTGCGIGISLVAANSERVDKLVLAAPWTHGDHYLTTMQNLRIAAARALDPVSYARFNAALLFPPEYRFGNEAGFNRLAEHAPLNPQNADDIARRLNSILAFDARPLLNSIACPTLVATAKDDQLMPPWFAQDAVGAIARAELCELDGGGHMLLETRAHELGAIVADFLKRQE